MQNDADIPEVSSPLLKEEEEEARRRRSSSRRPEARGEAEGGWRRGRARVPCLAAHNLFLHSISLVDLSPVPGGHKQKSTLGHRSNS